MNSPGRRQRELARESAECPWRQLAVGGFLLGKRFLLHDRDPLFSEAFRETDRRQRCRAGAPPAAFPQSECARGALCTDHPKSLLEYHQGLGNVLIFPAGVHSRSDGRVVCRERLGGVLKY